MTQTLPATYAGTTAAPTRLQGWTPTLAAYLAEVGQRTGSTRTPAEYGRVLGRFLELVTDPGEASPALVHSFAYAPGPSGREPSPSTVGVRLAAVGGFYGFARRMGLIAANPAAEVRRPHNRDPQPRGLTADELQSLLAAMPGTPSGLRDRAVVLTAVLTGLRRSEVMGLVAGDLSRNGCIYYAVRTKGGHMRRRELPLPAFLAIEASLEAAGRPLAGLGRDERLFPVTSGAFYGNLRRYALRAGLEGVTPHVLRHSAAKLRRDAGASLEDVQGFLGHRNLATTARYLVRLEGEHDNGWQAVAEALGV